MGQDRRPPPPHRWGADFCPLQHDGRDRQQLQRAELVSRGLQLGALDHLIKSQTTPGRLSQGIKFWTRPYAYVGEPEVEDGGVQADSGPGLR